MECEYSSTESCPETTERERTERLTWCDQQSAACNRQSFCIGGRETKRIGLGKKVFTAKGAHDVLTILVLSRRIMDSDLHTLNKPCCFMSKLNLKIIKLYGFINRVDEII